MASITDAQEAVLRSYVGENTSIEDLQEAYDRLENFDEVVLEELRGQLAVLVSDGTSVITVDGITLNTTANILALERRIKDFKSAGGTGLEVDSSLGVTVTTLTRPDYR